MERSLVQPVPDVAASVALDLGRLDRPEIGQCLTFHPGEGRMEIERRLEVSWMGIVLTVKGERTADHDATGKDYFVREVEYGAFQRSFDLPEGVDAAQVEAKCANGVLEVRIPAPRAATSRTIEVKAA